MGIKVQIGNTIQEVPVVGENKWAEKTTSTLLTLAEATSSLVGPADILTRESSLANNVSTPTSINGFRFDMSIVQAIDAKAVIVRTFTDLSEKTPLQEMAVIEASSFGGTVVYSVRYSGDNTGVKLFVADNGQVTYTSSNMSDTESIFIKFYAKAIVTIDE